MQFNHFREGGGGEGGAAKVLQFIITRKYSRQHGITSKNVKKMVQKYKNVNESQKINCFPKKFWRKKCHSLSFANLGDQSLTRALQSNPYQNPGGVKRGTNEGRTSLCLRLEDTARYADLLLAPAEGFGLRPRLFLPLGQKKAFYAALAHSRPFLVFSSNLGNFQF